MRENSVLSELTWVVLIDGSLLYLVPPTLPNYLLLLHPPSPLFSLGSALSLLGWLLFLLIELHLSTDKIQYISAFCVTMYALYAPYVVYYYSNSSEQYMA